MVVASGQMPYEFDAPLPIRAPKGAWPGINTPNVAMSGLTIEQAMFVYNAELRKWNFPDQLNLLQYNLYTHPDITPSSFEPKANGDTLEGLVGGKASLESIDNIEELRTQFEIFLFDFYDDDSVYGAAEFREAWFNTAYPESPSGSRVIVEIIPNILFSIIGPNFLRPELEDITGGDFITTTDPHWLGGSGVIFDIDCGEVVFNPFPFPREGHFFAPGTDQPRVSFGPVYPVVQTTAGNVPSVEPSRYQSDLQTGTFKEETNFNAINSGLVQIDGYALIAGTTIELVNGNDDNFVASVANTNDYTGHTQGLRAVRDGAGDNDPSARIYRTPTAQSSGLYRILTQNRKMDVPFTAIPSGFVSLWPQGKVRRVSNTGNLFPSNSNFIHGQELTVTSDGGLQRDAGDSAGVHVMDDAIWITSRNDSDGSGTFTTGGLYISSPYNGELVWYRPAERVLSTSGNFGPGPAHFGAHLGLMDIGTHFVRVSKTISQFIDTNTGNPTPNSDEYICVTHFQRYDKTTLDHDSEVSPSFTLQGEDATTASQSGPDGLHGAFTDGSDVYTWTEFGSVHRFDTSLSFVNAYSAPIARRRHSANGQLLYTLGGNVQVGDPLLSITGGSSSGIGVWSTTDPTGGAADVVGSVTHDSAKPLRAETHFGHVAGGSFRWHSIFDVSSATHVGDGVWGILQVSTTLYLVRMTEEPSFWQVRESIRLERTGDSIPIGGVPDDFPYEATLHDID